MLLRSYDPLSKVALMNSPRLHHVPCLDSAGLHRVACWEWGDPTNPHVLVCVHGLTRQGRDFDVLAQAMSAEYRVICPDVAGRGESDWLAQPMEYGIARYVADMVTVLAWIDAPSVHWVGTSMGGLIGLGVAALSGSPVTRLVLNDVGPVLEAQAIARIGSYAGRPKWWATIDDAADELLTVCRGFGTHTREQWLALTRPMLRPVPQAEGGGWKLHYDMAIGEPFKSVTPALSAAGEAALWRAYDAITCPTLLLRGADSDLLSPATAQAMTERGPRARLHEFADVGHAPTLVADEQVRVVREFLLGA